jgi:surfeit locus 1 family protein
LSTALERRIERRIVLLDPGEPNGYLRDWQAPGFSPQRHFAYAIQWWSFAGLAVILWIALSLR